MQKWLLLIPGSVALLVLSGKANAMTAKSSAMYLPKQPAIYPLLDWRGEAADITLKLSAQKFADEIAKLGGRVYISPVDGAIYRNYASTSQHSYGRAVDLMIENISLRDAFNKALELRLFSGIGVYPHWSPNYGLHVDIRPDRSSYSPALWSGIKDGNKQVYRSVEYGLNMVA